MLRGPPRWVRGIRDALAAVGEPVRGVERSRPDPAQGFGLPVPRVPADLWHAGERGIGIEDEIAGGAGGEIRAARLVPDVAAGCPDVRATIEVHACALVAGNAQDAGPGALDVGFDQRGEELT